MSRSKMSTRELAGKMYKCSQYGQETSDGIVTSNKGFSRKLNDFLKFMFSHYIEEEFRTEKLKDETYELFTESMLGEIYRVENNIQDAPKDKKIKRINKCIEVYAFIDGDYSRYCKSKLDEKNQDKKEENS